MKENKDIRGLLVDLDTRLEDQLDNNADPDVRLALLRGPLWINMILSDIMNDTHTLTE